MSEKITKDQQKAKLKELLTEYQSTVSAILTDYENLNIPVDDMMIVEIDAAQNGLVENLDDLIELEPDKETVLDILKDALFDDTVETDDVLSLLEESDVKDFVQSDFDICVKCTDNNLRQKLEDFVKTEIYPYYLDQQAYTNL